MNEVAHLLQEYNETMTGRACYGDPVWKILDGIDAQCAAAEIIPGVHTIWQLVMHMAFWEEVGMRRFTARLTPEEEESGNFRPTPAPDAEAWQRTLESFRSSNDEFRTALARIDPAQLHEKTPGGEHSFRWEVDGVVQHHIYHAGQIAILKKTFQAGRR